PEHLARMTPDEVAAYLRSRRLSHFLINLRSPLFSKIAFTSLFDPKEIPKYFKLNFRLDDNIILTWRTDPTDAAIPGQILTILDFKRRGILSAPFTAEFYKQTVRGDRPIRSWAEFQSAYDSFETDLDQA